MYNGTYKFQVGRYLYPVQLLTKDKKIYITFGYHKTLIAEIKAMDGARYHGFDTPPSKMWSINNNSRNRFQLKYLLGEKPYAKFNIELLPHTSERPIRAHQCMMVRHGKTRHCGIWGAEMGTGKTLAAIELGESIGCLDEESAWYVGPKAGVKAVELELLKWSSKMWPRMMTYENLTELCKDFKGKMPRYVIFDEAQRIKTPSAQRSQAAMMLAESMREEYDDDCYIIGMSGTPAPKSPVDWFWITEVVCPGFLKEGNIYKFKARLCLIEQRESTITGGVYPHIVTWLDDENKCKHCGKPKEDEIHSQMANILGEGHLWEGSKNEVAYLYERLKGLVLVIFKKDCLDLPEKQYEEIKLTPSVELVRAAKLITKNASRAIEALTLCRELSDGFQYTQIEDGERECPNCHGSGMTTIKVPKKEVDLLAPIDVNIDNFVEETVVCDGCGGTGNLPKYTRGADSVETPKDEFFKNDLEAHAEIGRYIVWGGFTETVDRLVRLANQSGWVVLRVDGRGYHGFLPDGTAINYQELLIGMDRTHPKYAEILSKYPRICFVGHPKAGGMALTLHASPTELFYSNCFDGEARMQAEDRAHRMGMDDNRGLVIKDLLMLPTDKLVLDNLKKKKKLQDISMGELTEAMEHGTGKSGSQ